MVNGYMLYQTMVYICQYSGEIEKVLMYWVAFGMSTLRRNLKERTY